MIFAAPIQRARLGNVAGCDAYLLSATPPDPLAGFTWSARLQTHNGDNVPLGLYQDVACTIPATEDFDPVAAIRGEFATGTIVITQSDEAKQGYLFEGRVILDGIDDFYSVPNFFMAGEAQGEGFVVGQLDADPPSAPSGAWSLGTQNDDLIPNSDGTIYDGFGSTVRKTTVNPAASMANPFVYNVTSSATEWTNRLNGTQLFTTGTNTVAWKTSPTIGKAPDGYFYAGALVAFLVTAQTLSAGQRSTIVTYLQSLQ